MLTKVEQHTFSRGAIIDSVNSSWFNYFSSHLDLSSSTEWFIVYIFCVQVVYEYRYSVDDQVSGVVNDRWEQRQGQFVKGSYSLLDPSGKVRTVSYEVDGPRGFVAVVKTTFPGIMLYWTRLDFIAPTQQGLYLKQNVIQE